MENQISIYATCDFKYICSEFNIDKAILYLKEVHILYLNMLGAKTDQELINLALKKDCLRELKIDKSELLEIAYKINEHWNI